MMIGDQFMNLYIQIFYPTIGPVKAFYLWWSVFVFENLGETTIFQDIKTRFAKVTLFSISTTL